MRDTGHGWGGPDLERMRELGGMPESGRRAAGEVAPRANGTAAAQRSPLTRWRVAGAAWVAGETQNAPGSLPARFGTFKERGARSLSLWHI